jgi:chaperonin GroEL
MDYRKAHAAPKRIVPPGDKLQEVVLKTMKVVSDVVGATLGPGGQPVLIERQDDLPPWITNDGVTVFKAIGFEDPVMQTVMEAYRQIAVRTANEAGDGTTTATILGAAIHRRTVEFCRQRPEYSPHRVLREMEASLKGQVLPTLEKLAIPTSLTDKKGRDTLLDVATVSAHGDVEMAQAVMRCYDICGDEGNVTLVEAAGPSRYEVEEVQGYPLPTGYEDGCGPFYGEFLREPSAHRTVLKAPMWLLYHGKLTEPEVLDDALSQIKAQEGVWGQRPGERDIVVVAPFFSESVLGTLALNWKAPHSPKILPVRVPQSPIHGGEREFLDDLAAVTGAIVYDPVTNPLLPSGEDRPGVTFEGLGMQAWEEETETGKHIVWRGRTEAFEVGRNRSSVFGYAEPDLIVMRTEELKSALAQARSKMEAAILTERIARLAGGIARLTIYGTSNGETSEKRDRAEDAVCAVRGALREGALYGGCWGMLQVAEKLAQDESTAASIEAVLVPALLEPFQRLLSNVGILDERVRLGYASQIQASKDPLIFNAMSMMLVDPRPAKKEGRRGIYDSAPAVKEAIRSSLSGATLMGTLGAIIAYGRDVDYERQEAASAGQIPFDVNEQYGGGTAMAVR